MYKNNGRLVQLMVGIWLATCIIVQPISASTSFIDAKAKTGSNDLWWVPDVWTTASGSSVTINLSTDCTVLVAWLGSVELMRDRFSWIETRLVVDGNEEPYTDMWQYTGDSPSADPRLTASVTCYVELGQGQHTIEVQAKSGSNADGWIYPCKLSIIAFKDNVAGIYDEPSSNRRRTDRKTLSIQPNPVASVAAINYSVTRKAYVSLKVFDTDGRLIRTILNGKTNPGDYRATWDGKDETGHHVSAGSYSYVFEQDGEICTKQAVTLR